jgi:hypothetical protein
MGSMPIGLWVYEYNRAVRRARGHEMTRTVNNARQLGMALFEFDSEYGKFPDSSTVAAVRQDTGSKLSLPDCTSNDLFAQLLATKIIENESTFYARVEVSTRKADNLFQTDATILEHGECGFAYISGLSANGDPNTPLVFGPVIPGTTTVDRKSCDGKAVVLKMDCSATTYPINSAGKIILPNGLDLLDPRQPFWHGKVPDVKWAK